MNSIFRPTYWPYDELQASRDPNSQTRFLLKTPWVALQTEVPQDQGDRTWALLQKLNDGTLTAQDLPVLSGLLSTLTKYPLSYQLPRAGGFGSDVPVSLARDTVSPRVLLTDLCGETSSQERRERVAARGLTAEWTWDAEAALEFSRTSQGYDPETLFTVARRFHLLNDQESNRTAEMLRRLRELAKEDAARFKKAAALIVRQNHYVTEKCDAVLRGALPLAQSASEEVLEFIQAESGHDRLLAKAVASLTEDPQAVTVQDSTVLLMDLFAAIAKTNFLAFSMVVDIFERTSGSDEDPLAAVLRSVGEETAARQLDHHRDINDAGEHENVAIGFLGAMQAVDRDYAIQALRMAELVTQVMHQISIESLRLMQENEK